MMVLLKIAAILAFIFVGIGFINPTHYHPCARRKLVGHSDRQVDHLLTYIGFDSVSTAAEEAKNPQRDIAVAAVLTGLAPWQSMADDPAPVDGLLPRIFGKVHPKFRAPSTATWIAGLRSRHSGGAYRAGPQRHSVLARR